MKNRLLLIIMLTVFALLAQNATAQVGNRMGRDPLKRLIYPPELIIRHQQKIGLTEEQRDKIVDMVGEGQKSFNKLNWQLRAESEAFVDLLKQERVDEAKALKMIDDMLEIENKIKKARISLFIRIKNELTPQQQIQLSKLRRFGQGN